MDQSIPTSSIYIHGRIQYIVQCIRIHVYRPFSNTEHKPRAAAHLAFVLSSSSVLMSIFAAGHPCWNACGVASSNCHFACTEEDVTIPSVPLLIVEEPSELCR